jgi:hypothetical protein
LSSVDAKKGRTIFERQKVVTKLEPKRVRLIQLPTGIAANFHTNFLKYLTGKLKNPMNQNEAKII